MKASKMLKIIAFTFVWVMSMKQSYAQGEITIPYDQVFPCTRSIFIVATGGTTPYTYDWIDASGNAVTPNTSLSGSQTFSAVGTYTVTIKDAGTGANQKTLEKTYTIGAPPDLTEGATATPVAVTCKGGSDGSVTLANLKPSIAVQGINWNLFRLDNSTNSVKSGAKTPASPTATTVDVNITGLKADTYRFSFRDGGQCTGEIIFTVTEPTHALNVIATQQVSSASGAINGEITVSVSGGTAPYTYSWADDNTATTANRTGLALGSYTVTVTDNDNITATETFTIAAPATPLNVSLQSSTGVSCAGDDGAIEVLASGGTPLGITGLEYAYLWAKTGDAAFSATTARITGLAAGTYTVTVTDSKGCTATQTITIATLPNTVSITEVSRKEDVCGGNHGEIEVLGSGGTTTSTSDYTYSWMKAGDAAFSATTARITGLAAGTYTVTVTDNNGCTATQTFIITAPAIAFTVQDITVAAPITCVGGGNDGSLTVSATGGTKPYRYKWIRKNGAEDIAVGGNTSTISGLATGTYSVTVTDKNGCSQTKSYEFNLGVEGYCSRIALSQTSLSFSDTKVGETAVKELTISNTGNAAMNVTGITYPAGFTGDWLSGTIAAGAVQTVKITFNPTEAKAYSGAITVTSDAGAGKNTLEVTGKGILVTGLEPTNLGLSGFTVFPNPAEDVLHIKLPNQNSPVALQLIDVNGQLVYERNAVRRDELSINVSAYRSGVYVLVLESGSKVTKRKVMIK